MLQSVKLATLTHTHTQIYFYIHSHTSKIGFDLEIKNLQKYRTCKIKQDMITIDFLTKNKILFSSKLFCFW